MKRTVILVVAVASIAVAGTLPTVAMAQGKPKAAAPGPAYADEDRDWGIAPTTRLRTEDYRAPTPRQIPGGRTLRTAELSQMLAKQARPYLIDVAANSHRTLSGAFWMEGAGIGNLNKDQEKRFLKAMANFAAGKKNRPLVFFCEDSQCWLAYNAARRAIAAGYTSVMWYRGGIAAWRAAGLPMSQADPFAW